MKGSSKKPLKPNRIHIIEALELSFSREPVIYVDVLLAENEEVQWNWIHTPQRSYMNGYKVLAKKTKKQAS